MSRECLIKKRLKGQSCKGVRFVIINGKGLKVYYMDGFYKNTSSQSFVNHLCEFCLKFSAQINFASFAAKFFLATTFLLK
jgi:hypothetical protein